MIKLLMALLTFSALGCSNKVIYDNLQLNQRQNCAQEPRPTYDECTERTNKSYEDYERERKELLETPDE